MSINSEQMRQIADLARLAVSEDHLADLQKEVTAILDFVDQLEAADTEQVQAMAHPMELDQYQRPDQVTQTDQRGDFQAIAPAVEAGVYLVPKVIE